MENKIIKILKKNPTGLTIAELTKKTKSSRFVVRSTLSKLEGAKKVSIRKIGMAKVYTLKTNKKK